jgi:probable F420-dependent oxidoreductase
LSITNEADSGPGLPVFDRKPGVALPGALRPGPAAELAAAAEAAGCEAIWCLDVRREPYLQAAAAVTATSRVSVGTNVAVAFARSPTVTASAAWDLSIWSGGRFVLGLGSQVGPTLEARYGVIADHPAPRIKDYIAAVRACFDTFAHGFGRYEGPYYRLRRPALQPGAELDVSAPPVYLAAVNPVMTRTAGECADGLAAHPFTSSHYVAEVTRPALAEGARRAGRPAPPLLLQLVVAPDRATGAAQMSAYTVPAYRRVLDHAGLGQVADAVMAATREGRRAEAREMIEREYLDLLGVIYEDDLEAGMARWAPLADRLSLSVPWYGMDPPEQEAAARRLIERIARL